jgi:hypothetical protein
MGQVVHKLKGSDGMNMKHNLYKHRIYMVWKDMRKRCFSSKYSKYESYGGRGITICDEWREDFLNFYNWAFDNGYADNLTIDRKDNDGNYEPSNCRWATRKEQTRNRRMTKMATYKGERLPLAELAEILNVDYNSLHYQVNKYEANERVDIL